MSKRAGYRQLIFACLFIAGVNLLLAIAKMLIGSYSASTAVLSDGVNSLSDVGVVGLSLFGFYLSRDGDDAEHPYGHEKIESVVAFSISAFLGASAVLVVAQGVKNLMNGTQVHLSAAAFAVTILSAGGKLLLSLYAARCSARFASPMLKALSVDYRADVLLSAAVLAGLIGFALGAWYCEPIATIIAAVFILRSAYDIFRQSFNQIVDRSVDDQTRQALEQIILGIDGVAHIDVLKTRMHGYFIYVDVDISIDGELSVYQGHDICERVHRAIEAGPYKVKHCMVHANPVQHHE